MPWNAHCKNEVDAEAYAEDQTGQWRSLPTLTRLAGERLCICCNVMPAGTNLDILVL